MNLSDIVIIVSCIENVEALSILLNTFPANFQVPIVVLLQLDSNAASNLASGDLGAIFQRCSLLTVEVVEKPQLLEAGKIYVVPHNHIVAINHGCITIQEDPAGQKVTPVDVFLSQIASTYREHLIAVLCPEFGSDSVSGAIHVKRAGGTVLFQKSLSNHSPLERLGLPPITIDGQINVAEIGLLLQKFLALVHLAQTSEVSNNKLQDIFEYISCQSGLDLHLYPTALLVRRICWRMMITHNHRLHDYVQYLQSAPQEIGEIIQTLLVVTIPLFYDFQYLRDNILPVLVAQSRSRGRVLRCWSAGCGTGEEPYWLAMLLADLLGAELPRWNIKIFATDYDETAITFARRGLYAEGLLEGLPPKYRTRFFVRGEQGYHIVKMLREMVIFGEHDLQQGVPFLHIDLIMCRKVLAYFTSELQNHLFNQFAFSLSPGGYLMLDKGERRLLASSSYELVSPDYMVYRRVDNMLQSVINLRGEASQRETLPDWVGGEQHIGQDDAETLPESLNGFSSGYDKLEPFLKQEKVSREALILWNEELQASKEEFETACEELQIHTGELRTLISMLELIFDNAQSIALALYNAQTMELILGSPRYCDMVMQVRGLKHNNLAGRKWYDLPFVKTRKQAMALWKAVMESRVQLQIPEAHCILNQSKQDMIWACTLIPIMDTVNPGMIRFVLVSAIEVTKQVQARENSERLNLLKDNFLSLASHELRTPLTSILANAELLRFNLQQPPGEEPDSDVLIPSVQQEQQISFVDRIIEQVGSMKKLIDDMLDITRFGGDVFELTMTEHVDIVALVQQVVDLQSVVSNRQLILKTCWVDLMATCDEFRIKQVLNNLLDNAIKYSSSSTPVVITIERKTESPYEAVISVRDEGNGISEEQQARIFDRFYRVSTRKNSRVDGLGLGLYIVYEIVTRHKGRVWLKSKVGAGSTFSFALPLEDSSC